MNDKIDGVIQALQGKVDEATLKRIATTSTVAKREHLLPEALNVFPVETPLLNWLQQSNRVLKGSGTAVSWYEVTGTGVGSNSAFYVEGGTPNAATRQLATQSASYKLMGWLFGVTGLARAAGQSFEDALVAERLNAITALKIAIEDAIINGDSGTDANSFDGLIKQIDAGNGSYVQDVAGALTLDVLNAALKASHDRGYQVTRIIMSYTEAKTLNDLVRAEGTTNIIVNDAQAGSVLASLRASAYVDPISGRTVEILAHRDLAAGTILGVPDRLPIPVPGKQGQLGLWWDELLPFTETELGVSTDTSQFMVKTYATMPFPARRGAFKLTGITS